MRLCVAALALCQIGQYLGEKDAFVFCQLSLDRTLTRSNAAAANWCAASNGGPDGSRRGRTPFELGDFGGHAGSLLVDPGIPSTRHEASASNRPAVSPPSETPPVHRTASRGTMAAPDVRSVASPVLSRASPRCRRCPIRTRRPRYRRSRLDR